MNKELGFTLDLNIFEGNAPSYQDDKLLFVLGKDTLNKEDFNINPELINSYNKIKELIFGLSKSFNKEYLIKTFKDVYSNPEVKRSYGFIESRIFANSFLSYLHNNDSFGIEYMITKDFYVLPHNLNLKIPKDLYKHAFHINLAAINVITKNNDYINFEAIWLGDSSIFSVTSKGLRILNKKSHKDNRIRLFYRDYDEVEDVPQDFEFNYQKFHFEEPTILFVCSNSILENTFNFEFEDILLTSLMYSNDLIEFKNNLNKELRKRVSKDSSLSLFTFGFKDFDDLKKYFVYRFKEIKKLNSKYFEYKDLIKITDNNAYLYDPLYEYLLDDIDFNMDEIINTISNNFNKKSIKNLLSENIINDIRNKEIMIKSQILDEKIYDRLNISFSNYIKLNAPYFDYNLIFNDGFKIRNIHTYKKLKKIQYDISEEFKDYSIYQDNIKDYYDSIKELKSTIKKIKKTYKFNKEYPIFNKVINDELDLDELLLDLKRIEESKEFILEINKLSHDSNLYCVLEEGILLYEVSKPGLNKSSNKIKKYLNDLVNIFNNILNTNEYNEIFNESNITNDFINVLDLYYKLKPSEELYRTSVIKISLKEYFKDINNKYEFIYNRLKINSKTHIIDEYLSNNIILEILNKHKINKKDIDLLIDDINKYMSNFNMVITNL